MGLLLGTNSWDVIGLSRSTSAYFNSTYLTDCAHIPDNQNAGVINFPAGVTDTVWFHFTIRCDAVGSAEDGNAGPFIYDANGNRLFYFEVSNGNWAYFCNADAALNSGYVYVGTGTRTYDLKFQLTGGVMYFEVWLAGALVWSTSGACVGGRGLPRKAQFSANDCGNLWISELIVMDTPTVGRKLMERKPVSAGADADWSGGFAELGDNDTLSVASASNVGDRVSSVPAVWGGSTAGAIEAIAIESMGNTTIGSPQAIAHYMKIAAVNYDGADQAMGDVKSYRETIWGINPATGLAWTYADLATIEMGLKTGT